MVHHSFAPLVDTMGVSATRWTLRSPARMFGVKDDRGFGGSNDVDTEAL